MNAPLTHGCEGKATYASKADAVHCLRFRAKRRAAGPKGGRGGAQIYRCNLCKHWHIGSDSFRPKEQRR